MTTHITNIRIHAAFLAIAGILSLQACGGATAAPAGEAATAPAQYVKAESEIEAGRYLVKIAGCNDCHTPGYLSNAGDVPEARWLTGDSIGFQGPWGTTYPSNLRRLIATMDEEAWVHYARTIETRPPMPWFNLRAFTEADLRAIHRYIRSLPPDNTSVPDHVPPGRQPATPYIVMVPKSPQP